MTWSIEITATAAKQIKRMDKSMMRRVVAYLQGRLAVAEDPHAFGKALTGNYGGLWRYRVGDWRIICHLENRTIIVLWIAHRREAYK